jgi:hypothetical protein
MTGPASRGSAATATVTRGRDAMSDAAPIAVISSLPLSMAGRWLVRVRARRRRAELDAALAQGADPWSTPELMVRASQLGSLSERRKIGAGLYALVAVARRRRRSSPLLEIRHRVVLEQRDSLVALAQRLVRPAPVEVAVVAQLALLLADSASPIYAGGRDPDGLAEVTGRCLASVADDRLSG